MNDAELIRRIRERDETALSALETRFGRRLGKVARNILKNEEDVSECLNDVYLKAWNSLPAAAPENLEAYLTALTCNTALKRVRDGNAQKRIPQELILPLDEAAGSIHHFARELGCQLHRGCIITGLWKDPDAGEHEDNGQHTIKGAPLPPKRLKHGL